jgi:hypothetical protein
LVGNELKLNEPLACHSQFLSAEVQARRQCGSAIVAQALRISYGNEKQVQRSHTVVAALDEVALHQRLVNPAEVLGNLAQALRAKH